MKKKSNKAPIKLFPGIRSAIISGLIIVLPIALTIWFGDFIFTKLTEWGIDFITTHYNSFLYEGEGDAKQKVIWAFWLVRGCSILLILAILCILGIFGRYTLGKKVIKITDVVMRKLPMLSIVYTTARQIWDAIWSTNGGMFNKVVMFEYPRKGIWVIGFLTNENEQEDWEVQNESGEDLVSVFLPTTPNPTSGFLLFIPRKDCKYLDMDVADGMRLVISGGAVTGQTSEV